MTFKGHSGPDICLLQEQATGILQNLNADLLAARDVFHCWNAKENFSLQVYRATPDIEGSCIHQKGKI